MTIGDIYEIRIEGITTEAERWNQVFHMLNLQDEQDTLFVTALGLAEKVGALAGSNLLPLIHEDASFLSTRVNRIFPSIGVPATSGQGAGSGAINTSDPLPADIAAVVTKRTDLPGARFRGRTYFTGLAEEQQDVGLLDAAVAEDFANAAKAIMDFDDADGNGNFWNMVVFSRVAVGIGNEPFYGVVDRLLCDRVLRNQRNRSTTLTSYVGTT